MGARGLVRGVVWVYQKELRSLLRDHHTFAYSVLVPLFLYPGILWVALEGTVYLKGEEERIEARVLLSGAGSDDPLARFLAESRGLAIERVPEAPADPRALLVAGGVDVVLERVPAPPGGRSVLRLHFSGARSSSASAKRRLEAMLESYRTRELSEEARKAGRSEDFLDVLDVVETDLSTREELANYIASLILPLIFIFMIATGALYPALETTVGERERGTLETSLLAPIPRVGIVGGKYLAVVTFSLLAFVLNLASMGFTLMHLRSRLDLQGLSLSAGAVGVMLAAAVLLAFLVGAFLMPIGFIARTFREGQACVTPVYLVAVVPAFVLSNPTTQLTTPLAFVPVVNVALLFRGALQGTLDAANVSLALGVTFVVAIAAVSFAARLLNEESFVLDGKWPSWMRLPRRSRSVTGERAEGVAGWK